MRKRIILAVCLVCVFVYGFAYIWTFGFCRGEDLKRIQTLRTLVAQNVKVGDPPDRVIHFLVAQHLEYSTLGKANFMHISGHDYGNQNFIEARRHVAGSLFWDESVEFIFVFDDKYQLTKFDVMPLYTSF